MAKKPSICHESLKQKQMLKQIRAKTYATGNIKLIQDGNTILEVIKLNWWVSLFLIFQNK